LESFSALIWSSPARAGSGSAWACGKRPEE
jgi:hypothetical protein